MTELDRPGQQFILHWGEMSSRWGVNRSVAQIHALLYIAGRALNAEDIASTLSIARSNVSTSLRELQAWGIVRVVHELGDRRDYYQATDDPWEMLKLILEQRKKREIDPTIEVLRQCVGEDGGAADNPETRARMAGLLELLETLTTWYDEMINLPRSTQKKVLKLGNKLQLIGSMKRKT